MHADGFEMVVENRDGPRITLVRVVKQLDSIASENGEE